jgi:hypothetical protein
VAGSAFDAPRRALLCTQHFGVYRNEARAAAQFDLMWALSDDVAAAALAAAAAAARRHQAKGGGAGSSQGAAAGQLRKRPGELTGPAADAVRAAQNPPSCGCFLS